MAVSFFWFLQLNRRTFKNAEKRVTSCEIEFTDKTIEYIR